MTINTMGYTPAFPMSISLFFNSMLSYFIIYIPLLIAFIIIHLKLVNKDRSNRYFIPILGIVMLIVPISVLIDDIASIFDQIQTYPGYQVSILANELPLYLAKFIPFTLFFFIPFIINFVSKRKNHIS